MGETRERSSWPFLRWVGFAVLVYVLVFAVIMLDTFLFKNVVYEALGPELRSVFEIVYYPLIEMVKDLGWVDD